MFLCCGSDGMWRWCYVVVEAVHVGDSRLCVVVHGGILQDCIMCMVVVVYNE